MKVFYLMDLQGVELKGSALHAKTLYARDANLWGQHVRLILSD